MLLFNKIKGYSVAFWFQWLEKVSEMKKVKADAETRAGMEEMNPGWLKEKGGYVIQ